MLLPELERGTARRGDRSAAGSSGATRIRAARALARRRTTARRRASPPRARHGRPRRGARGAGRALARTGRARARAPRAAVSGGRAHRVLRLQRGPRKRRQVRRSLARADSRSTAVGERCAGRDLPTTVAAAPIPARRQRAAWAGRPRRGARRRADESTARTARGPGWWRSFRLRDLPDGRADARPGRRRRARRRSPASIGSTAVEIERAVGAALERERVRVAQRWAC